MTDIAARIIWSRKAKSLIFQKCKYIKFASSRAIFQQSKSSKFCKVLIKIFKKSYNLSTHKRASTYKLSVALILLTPALLASSFWILKVPTFSEVSICGPPQSSSL